MFKFSIPLFMVGILLGNAGLMNNSNAAETSYPGEGKCYAQYQKTLCTKCEGNPLRDPYIVKCTAWGTPEPQKWTEFGDVKVDLAACHATAQGNVPPSADCSPKYSLDKVCFCTSPDPKDCLDEKGAACNPNVNP